MVFVTRQLRLLCCHSDAAKRREKRILNPVSTPLPEMHFFLSQTTWASANFSNYVIQCLVLAMSALKELCLLLAIGGDDDVDNLRLCAIKV